MAGLEGDAILVRKSHGTIVGLRKSVEQATQMAGGQSQREKLTFVVIRMLFAYWLVCGVAALLARAIGQRASGVIFVLATLGLMTTVARATNRKPPGQGKPTLIAGILWAVVIGTFAAFFAFVLIVNIWERLGLPH